MFNPSTLTLDVFLNHCKGPILYFTLNISIRFCKEEVERIKIGEYTYDTVSHTISDFMDVVEKNKVSASNIDARNLNVKGFDIKDHVVDIDVDETPNTMNQNTIYRTLKGEK